jgi:MraZ protein
MVFIGEYPVSFSAPGRIVLPKKIREQLTGTTFIITRGFDSSLSGYDRKTWEEKAQDLVNVSLIEQTDLKKRRLLFSSALYVEIDEQGRFVIPKSLLNDAGIKEKVVIIGAGDHFEVWSEKDWNTYKKSIEN